MTVLREVLVPSLPFARFRDLIGDERYESLEAAAARARTLLDGRTLWNVNSTASGGGVAEMHAVLVGYTRGAGLDVRWLVTQGDEEFFAITKRIHNRIHGAKGDDGDLGPAEAAHYEHITQRTRRSCVSICMPATSCCCTTPRRQACARQWKRAMSARSGVATSVPTTRTTGRNRRGRSSSPTCRAPTHSSSRWRNTSPRAFRRIGCTSSRRPSIRSRRRTAGSTRSRSTESCAGSVCIPETSRGRPPGSSTVTGRKGWSNVALPSSATVLSIHACLWSCRSHGGTG